MAAAADQKHYLKLDGFQQFKTGRFTPAQVLSPKDNMKISNVTPALDRQNYYFYQEAINLTRQLQAMGYTTDKFIKAQYVSGSGDTPAQLRNFDEQLSNLIQFNNTYLNLFDFSDTTKKHISYVCCDMYDTLTSTKQDSMTSNAILFELSNELNWGKTKKYKIEKIFLFFLYPEGESGAKYNTSVQSVYYDLSDKNVCITYQRVSQDTSYTYIYERSTQKYLKVQTLLDFLQQWAPSNNVQTNMSKFEFATYISIFECDETDVSEGQFRYISERLIQDSTKKAFIEPFAMPGTMAKKTQIPTSSGAPPGGPSGTPSGTPLGFSPGAPPGGPPPPGAPPGGPPQAGGATHGGGGALAGAASSSSLAPGASPPSTTTKQLPQEIISAITNSTYTSDIKALLQMPLSQALAKAQTQSQTVKEDYMSLFHPMDAVKMVWSME